MSDRTAYVIGAPTGLTLWLYIYLFYIILKAKLRKSYQNLRFDIPNCGFIKVILTITISVSKSGKRDQTSGHKNAKAKVLNTCNFNA
jgi:uncharacterized BrkB/YihY/UPF0761 family membrane protein